MPEQPGQGVPGEWVRGTYREWVPLPPQGQGRVPSVNPQEMISMKKISFERPFDFRSPPKKKKKQF